MNKSAALLALLLAIPSVGSAAHILSAEERLNLLEERQAELYRSLAEKKQAGLHTLITDRISISGLIEVEGFWSDESVDFRSDALDDRFEKASDLTLSTAQLGFGATINEEITADLTLLFEEGEDFTMDEAYLSFERNSWGFRAGLFYVPFGAFNTNLISDPLTLELGETQETALMATFSGDLYALSAFVFNGDSSEAGRDNHIRDFGFAFDAAPVPGLEVGGSFLSDIADTDAELVAEYRDAVAGWSAYALVGLGYVELSAEGVGAMERFRSDELDADGNGKGDRPLAWNLELSSTVSENLVVAARLEGSDELVAPELQYGAAVSWGIFDNTTLAFEYLHGDFDDAIAVNAERDQFTAQLAVEF